MAAIVVANPDGFAPTQALHALVAKHLPKGARLVVLQSKDHDDAWCGAAPPGAVALKAGTDSPWARDFSPTFVRTRAGALQAVEFKYGYEGADAVATQLARKLGVPVVSSPLVIEGGNLLADDGRVFLTDKVLRANKGMKKADVEAELKRVLHADEIVWMKPLPDEATGHIDMYAKLLAPKTMLVSDTAHPAQKAVLDDAAARFAAKGYRVVRAENPAFAPSDPDVAHWGPTRSYANALIVNGTAFVPQYLSDLDKQLGHGRAVAKLDKQALAAYAKAGLTVVGVPANDLINFQGSVHCMTNTVPAGVDVGRLAR